MLVPTTAMAGEMQYADPVALAHALFSVRTYKLWSVPVTRKYTLCGVATTDGELVPVPPRGTNLPTGSPSQR